MLVTLKHDREDQDMGLQRKGDSVTVTGHEGRHLVQRGLAVEVPQKRTASIEHSARNPRRRGVANYGID